MLPSVKRVKTNSARSDFCGREQLLLAWQPFPIRPVWICGRGAIEAAPPRHPSLPPAAAKRATEEGEQDATPARYCCATAKSMRVSGLWRKERTQFQKTSLAAGRAGVRFGRTHGPNVADRTAGWRGRSGGARGGFTVPVEGTGQSFALGGFIHLGFGGFPQEMRPLAHFQPESVVQRHFFSSSG